MIAKASLVKLDWHTDPKTHGQMVEIAHAVDTDNADDPWLYRRYYDRNCGGVYYYRAFVEPGDWPVELRLHDGELPEHDAWEPCDNRKVEL